MPGMYPPGEYDLAGFAVGVVERSAIVDGSRIAAGDQLVGLASSGPHANGYSLIRRVLERAAGEIAPSALAAPLEGRPLADWVMAPTRIYARSLMPLLREPYHPGLIRGMAHVTGGGLVENVPRMLPPGLQAAICADAWQRPAIFRWLQEAGGIADAEMYRVFNCGIGMVLAVAATDLARVLRSLESAGETACHLGEIVARQDGAPATVVA
jgi:phosphoribosylformylglycinamidine cyclo-ligase